MASEEKGVRQKDSFILQLFFVGKLFNFSQVLVLRATSVYW